jgi:hypothetical protein
LVRKHLINVGLERAIQPDPKPLHKRVADDNDEKVYMVNPYEPYGHCQALLEFSALWKVVFSEHIISSCHWDIMYKMPLT